MLSDVQGSGIVYLRTREGAELLARELLEEGIEAQYYHAGLPHSERGMRQNDWTEGRKRVMVATTAFGMGIDKPDVRFVVHYDIPNSLEEYYQEAGRAGRDGKRSYSALLAGADEKMRIMGRLSSDFPSTEQIKAIYEKLFNYLQVGIWEGKEFYRAFA